MAMRTAEGGGWPVPAVQRWAASGHGGVLVATADGAYARAVCLQDLKESLASLATVMDLDPASDWQRFATLAMAISARPFRHPTVFVASGRWTLGCPARARLSGVCTWLPVT